MRFALVALAALMVPSTADAQAAEAKVANAMAAAPRALASQATVKDWDGTVLREGTSRWVCMPDMPHTAGNDPMCLDQPWLQWIEAFSAGTAPSVDRIGFGYMLAGDAPVSNIDPAATAPTPDNEWLAEGVPHVMMIVPASTMLRGLPTHPDQAGGGPWIMWRDTPYVHVMIPLPARAPQGH